MRVAIFWAMYHHSLGHEKKALLITFILVLPECCKYASQRVIGKTMRGMRGRHARNDQTHVRQCASRPTCGTRTY